MITKIWLIAMVVITLLYAFLLFERGVVLISDPQPVAVALGITILFFPLIALASIFYEIRFGFRLAKLGKLLERSGMELPEYELRPSGKATKTSGDEVFESLRRKLENDETNYLLWFLLADSYDKLGDRRRARAAARKSISFAKKAKAL
ncbi:MAG: hypothetical protein RL537_414 [Actinomycetota bacterium]